MEFASYTHLLHLAEITAELFEAENAALCPWTQNHRAPVVVKVASATYTRNTAKDCIKKLLGLQSSDPEKLEN